MKPNRNPEASVPQTEPVPVAEPVTEPTADLAQAEPVVDVLPAETAAEPAAEPVTDAAQVAPATDAQPSAIDAPPAEHPAAAAVAAEKSAPPAAPKKGKPAKKPKAALTPAQKKKRRMRRIVALSIAGAFVLSIGIYLMVAFLSPQKRAIVDMSYGSAMKPVAQGETYSADADYGKNYIDLFARLNWTFAQQDNWYGEYHGTVYSTGTTQDVQTYKLFDNGVLISYDITESSIVNLARQFCYSLDDNRVVWREDPPKNKNNWAGPKTVFPDVAPSGNMDITGYDAASFAASFKGKNGLPATELSMYVFTEDTIRACDGVTANDDGTFTVTYSLDPTRRTMPDGTEQGATAYYGNQMVFTGGIDEPPTFESISIGYTFDENFVVSKCTIAESYKASMKKLAVTCSSTAETTYTYDVPALAEKIAEEYEYFRPYIEGETTGQQASPLTATDCLVSAFGNVLSGPALLAAKLDIGDRTVDGKIYIDLGADGMPEDLSTLLDFDKIDLRAAFGGVKVWLTGGNAYLDIGGLKLSVGLADAIAAIPSGSDGAEATATAASADAEPSLLGSLLDAEVVRDEENGTASLHWDISLGKLDIPIDFDFAVEEQEDDAGKLLRTVSLNNAVVKIGLSDVCIGADFSFDEEGAAPAAFDPSESASYVALGSYVPVLADILLDKTVSAELTYSYALPNGKTLGLVGTVGLDFVDTADLAVAGELAVSYGESVQTVGIAYAADGLYLKLGGIGLRVSVPQAIDLVRRTLDAQTLAAIDTAESKDGFSLADFLTRLWDIPLTELLELADTTDGGMSLLVHTTGLLDLFGIDAAIDDVSIVIDKTEAAVNVALPALGLGVSVHAGASVERPDPSAYVDATDAIGALTKIFAEKRLAADIGFVYEIENGGTVGVTGTVGIDFADGLAVSGTLVAAYGPDEQTVTFAYAGETVYAALGGLRFRGDVDGIVALVKRFLPETDPSEDALGDLLARLFALKFDDLLAVSGADGDLDCLLKGTDLLSAFGIEFALGDVTLSVDADKASLTAAAPALGLTVSVGKGAAVAPVADPETYTDVVTAAGIVADIVEGGVIDADLTAAIATKDGELALGATLGIDFADPKAVALGGTLTATLGGKTQTVRFDYEQDGLYLALGTLKLYANVSDAIDIVKRFLPGADAVGAEESNRLDALLGTVFGLDVGTLASLSGSDGDLALVLHGTELLRALGTEFALGNVTLSVDAETHTVALDASDLGVRLTAKSGESVPPVTDKETYTDLTAVFAAAADIYASGGVTATISYTDAAEGKTPLGLTASLGIDFADTQSLAASGELTVTYGKLTRTFAFSYGDDEIFLSIEALKLRLSVSETIDVVKSFLPQPTAAALEGSEAAGSFLQRLFGLDIGSLLTVGATENNVSLVLHGTDLLSALGIEFALGNVTVGLDTAADTVTVATEIGLQASVRAGATVARVPAEAIGDYASLSDVVKALPSILEHKAISVSGSLHVTVGETVIGLAIENGYIGWANGLAVSLDATLSIGGSKHDIFVSYSGDGLTVAYGPVGICLSGKEALATVRSALTDTVDRLGAFGKKTGLDALIDALRGTAAVAALVDENASGFDWQSLVDNLHFVAAENGGFGRLTYGGFWVEIADKFVADGTLGLTAGFESDAVMFDADFAAGVCEGAMPSAPSVDCLTAENIAELLGFVVSAVDLAEEPGLNIVFEGETRNSSELYTATDGVKFDVSGSIDYYAGEEGFPIRIGATEADKGITVDSDLYLKVDFDLVARNEADDSLYLDLLVLDAAPGTGAKDGILDFYVTVTKFRDGDKDYMPLRFYVPSSDLMTVIASALSLVGVDIDVLDEYVILQAIENVETVEQLRALGDSLKEMIFDLFPTLDLQALVGKVNDLGATASELLAKLADLLGSFSSDAATPATVSLAPLGAPTADEAPVRNGVVKAIDRSETTDETSGTETVTYQVVFESGLSLVFGRSVATAEDGTETARLSLGINGISSKQGVENTDFGVSVAPGTVVVPETVSTDGYYDFRGISDLIVALAKSTTSQTTDDVVSGEEDPHYTLNKTFYIEGSIKANLLKIVDVEIKLVAVSVSFDENGDVALNVRISYDGKAIAVVAINGDSVVDLTLKGGMVYIKRVQTSEFYSILNLRRDIDPVTIYRAMPAAHLMSDMLNQMSFILNFGEMISEQIAKGENGDGSTGTPAESVTSEDYGAQVKAYLTEYAFNGSAAGGGKSWSVTIDGDKFSNGILDTLSLTIAADGDDMIRSLNVTNAVIAIPVSSSFNLNLTLTAELTWYNPGGVMDEGKAEQTDPTLAAFVSDKAHGMGGAIELLDAQGWGDVKYLEGETKTVSVVRTADDGSESVYLAQDVMVSLGADGYERYALYSGDFATDRSDLFTADGQWQYDFAAARFDDGVRTFDVLPGDGKLPLTKVPRRYDVTFVSDEKIDDGWTYEDATGKYVLVRAMNYGATITLVGTETKQETVEGEMRFEIPAAPALGVRKGLWDVVCDRTGATITLVDATVTLHSAVAFEGAYETDDGFAMTKNYLNSAELPTPTAAGYIFLGWFEHTETGWVRRTSVSSENGISTVVEALWAQDGWFKFEASKSSTLGVEQYAASVGELADDKLVGAFAAELTRQSVRYAFVFDTSEASPAYPAFGDANSANDSRGWGKSKYTHAHVKVQAVYAFADGTTITVEAEAHAKM